MGKFFKKLERARKYAKKTGGKIYNTGDIHGYTSKYMRRGHLVVK